MLDMSKTSILIFILVVIVILSSVPTIFKCSANRKEGFLITQELYKRYCPYCSRKNKSGCSKCMNCGWGVNARGEEECMPGDSYGAYFRSDLIFWNFGKTYNPYSMLSPSISDFYGYPRRRRRRRWRNWWQYRKPGRYRYYNRNIWT